MGLIKQTDCEALDDSDPLAHCRQRFALDAEQIYLDGNSLGAKPISVDAILDQAVKTEWQHGLIGSWNNAGWFDLPITLGNKLGVMLGAAVGQTVVCDTTSGNLYKCIHAALSLQPERHVIVAEGDNFPTDLYVIEGVVESHPRPLSVRLTSTSHPDFASLLDDDVAVVVLSHVNYQSGKLLDMVEATRLCHQQGALVVWDLCHSAGVLPIELDACEVDFAVGCCYKFLNGGPGAPAFLYTASRHLSKAKQPLSGWWGHARPFSFESSFVADAGIKKFLCGTQPILSMRAVEAGLDSYANVDMMQVREKSMALTALFIELLQQQCGERDWQVLSPQDAQQRGSQVSIGFEHAYAVVQALIEQGVTGDFREPNVMRFGFAPLYNGYVDVWHAVEKINDCLNRKVWLDPRYTERKAVT